MLKATYRKCVLQFKQPSGTSRGILTEKISWFIILYENDDSERTGIGECGLLKGLSIDDHDGFEPQLRFVCDLINSGKAIPEKALINFPTIRFGLETALLDLASTKQRILFPSEFTAGRAFIPINGLVWMGSLDFMEKQIRNKINDGYTCIKLKIGAIDFEQELNLIKLIRKNFSPSDIEIRVDANGAFAKNEALEKLKRLSDFHIHSIEQPIKQGQWEEMAKLSEQTPLPIALDEELIGIQSPELKLKMITQITPAYLILKPGLLGGFEASNEWINLANNHGIKWWVTSALESNIGLNAIAQWTFTLKNDMHQGLGTGLLFANNIPSPLTIESGALSYRPNEVWQTNMITDGYR